MKSGRRFVAALAVSSLLAVGFSLGGGTTTAYAAGSISATIASFCDGLTEYIARLESRPELRLRDFLLLIATQIQQNHCSL